MVTAAVVLYNTPQYMFSNLLHSYKPDTGRKLYIIDNSEKPTIYCKNVCNDNIIYIYNGKNIGYGAAHNIGIQRAILDESRYHVILNPDIVFDSSVIDSLKCYADKHDDIVYMLPEVIYPNGKIQYLCKLLPTPFDLFFRRFIPCTKITQKWNDRYVLKMSGYNKIINPPCLSGCFMFLKTSALAENNLRFDERFFMYFEDFDLIRRLHRIGRTVYYPDVQIVHEHGRESYRNKKMLLLHIKSACIYFHKYGWFIDRERKSMNHRILQELAESV